MKFKSRRDNTFKFIFGALSLLFAILIGESFLFTKFSENYVYVFDSIIGVIWIFVIWIYIDTSYKVNDKAIKYRSGPIFGSINLENINKIIVGKTAWSGFKFALARKGIVIEHNEGDQVYISPKTNEDFVEYIKSINPSIKIEYYRYHLLK